MSCVWQEGNLMSPEHLSSLVPHQCPAIERTMLVLILFVLSGSWRKLTVLCIDIIYSYVQSVLICVGSAFIQTMLWYIRTIAHLSYSVVFFCISAEEWRDICSKFTVVLHTSLWFSSVRNMKLVCASVFVPANTWMLCCILLHNFTQMRESKNADANARKHRTQKLCFVLSKRESIRHAKVSQVLVGGEPVY